MTKPKLSPKPTSKPEQVTASKITYSLRAASCKLGASAMVLFDQVALWEEANDRDPGMAPSLLIPTGDAVVDALRLAKKRLAVSAASMEMTISKHAREKAK